MVIVKFPTAEKKTVVQAPTVTNDIGYGEGWYVPVPDEYEYDSSNAKNSTYKITSLKNVGPTITYADDASKEQIVVTDPVRNTIGKSTMVLSLSDPESMIWSDTRNNKPKEFPYELHKLSIIKPDDSITPSFVYDGTTHWPERYRIYESITDEKHPVSYYTVSDVIQTHYDGATESLCYWFIRQPIGISDPKLTGNEWLIGAATYTTTYSLNSYNHDYIEWSDGTYDDVVIHYKIVKAPGTLALSATTASITSDNNPITINLTNAIGTVTVATSNSSYATATCTNSAVTITGVSQGNTTITVTDPGDSNHESKTITISVEVAALVVRKKFSEATDDEIVKMVAAAGKGQLDLEKDCGWAVGQEHQVSLPAISKSGSYDGTSWSVGEDQSAQTVTLVLMDTGANSGYKFSSGETAHFVVGLKNAMTTAGYMNSSSTNSASWDGSARRKWCNGGFRQAMESVLPGVFKQFNVVTAASYNGSSNKTSTDYFSLFAAKEIFGGAASSAGADTSYSNLTEFRALKQIKWYETSSNRVKKRGDNGSVGSWWGRSPGCSYSNIFCRVGTDGSAGSRGAGSTYGLAPFGCI